MANCIYTLYGRVFNSDLELDNFLMNNRHAIEAGKVSDIVFSRITGQENVVALLDTKQVEVERIRELQKIKKQGGSLTFEDEQLIGDYMGVNKAMAEFTNEQGNKLIPKFIEDSLKQHLYPIWATDGLSKNYAELLGQPEGTKYTTLQAQENAFNLLMDGWKKLGVTGTMIHRILELGWQCDNDNKTQDEFEQIVQNDPDVNMPINIIREVDAVRQRIKAAIKGLGPQFSNCKFIPEYPVTADTTVTNTASGNPYKLLGIIDLLVIDNNGKVHLFDYKVSNKDYSDWTSSKRIGFKYQLAAYKLALEAYGLDTSGSMLGIIPLQVNDFNRNNGNISNVAQFLPNLIDDLSSELHPSSKIIHNLLRIIVNNYTIPPISNNFVTNMDEQMHRIFPNYRFQQQMDEAIEKDLELDLVYNDSTGKYELRNKKSYGKNEFDSVQDYHEYLNARNEDSFRYYNSLLHRAIEAGDPSILSQEESKAYLEGVSREWFQNQFAQFCTGNGEWEMPSIPEFEALGIIILHNKRGGYYKIYTLDNTNPKTKVRFEKGTSVLGSFVDDITPEQLGVVPLEGDVGNVNNMKIMLALNNFPDIIRHGEFIEGIYPICPRAQLGHHAAAKQLRDNFRMLCDYAGIQNNFENGRLQFQPAYLVAHQLIREYGIQQNTSNGLNKIYSKYETGALTLEETLTSLLKVKQALEEEYRDLTTMTDKGPKIDFSTPQGQAYGKIMQAIAEIQDGYYTQDFRDQTRMSMKHIIDNPEVQDHNVRTLYKLTTNFNETYKRRMNDLAAEYREVQEKFWKKKGYTIAQRNALNNERELFAKMFDDQHNGNGIFRFKNPWDNNNDLNDAEREFLKWILNTLAKLKNPEASNLEIEQMRGEGNFFDVPLMRAEGSNNPFTKNGRKGAVQWFKKSMDYFKNFRENIKTGVTGLLTAEDAKKYENDAEVFKIFDIFERSDNEVKREQFLRETDLDIFDKDVGNILYVYAAAKLRKQVLEQYTPMLQAQLVQIMMEAATNNINQDGNIDYILKYVKSKIFDASIVPEQWRGLAKALSKVRTITTYMALGWSPKSGLFQMIEGVWKNASRAGFKPLGENQFGKDELIKAARWILGDTPNHLKIVSMGELLNEKYAINDMDVSSFAKHLKEGQYPLTLAGKAMWFTSAPDYFNRMSIFIAQMIKDGCFEAYEKDGMRLKYNWKKDKRFSAFANGDRRDMTKYNKQKALYHAMMAQFKAEGYQIKDENGNYRDLQYDPTSDVPQDALPEAYTNRDARNIKSFADQLYGYYNREDQFLLKSMLLGAQFTQFRTYWSSLKNRYFLRGGVYSNGGWEQAKDKDGNLMYKKFNLDENGRLISVELVTEDTGEPYIIWKGSYQEGIAVTLKECLTALFDPNSDLPLKERAINILHGKTGNENEDVIRARVTNLKLFAHDMAIWLIVGMLIGYLLTKWLKQQEKEDKNKKLGFADLTLRSAESILVSSLVASTQDLGAVKDLISPLTDWTPPSFRLMKNIWDDGCNVITGDKSLTKAIVENFAVARQTRSYWYQAERVIEESN